MINSKITKTVNQPQSTEDKVLKFLENIDWKLWEIYNMMKKELDAKKMPVKKASKKTIDSDEE